jgi:two-component system, OmpR family, phosphate regulon response regulator PhoB
MNSLVLIADDEADVLKLVSSHLTTAGFQALQAGDGTSALALIRERLPALAVLDVMMPGLSGLDVLRAMKNSAELASIPVVLLTARVSPTDRIVAFELGADDYVTKPFSPRELVLRVHGILRRSKGAAADTGRLVVGSLRLDADRHEVTAGGQRVDVTAVEFKLLSALMERSGRVQSRDALISTVWGDDQMIESRTVDTHLRRLREKLGPAGNQIRTVRGFGYRMDES